MYYEVYQSADGQWRWRLRAANHEKIADCCESYKDRDDALHGLNLVKQSADAPVRDAND